MATPNYTLSEAVDPVRFPLSAARNCPPPRYPNEALAARVTSDPVNRYLLEALWHRGLSLEEIAAAWNEMISADVPF